MLLDRDPHCLFLLSALLLSQVRVMNALLLLFFFPLVLYLVIHVVVGAVANACLLRYEARIAILMLEIAESVLVGGFCTKSGR